VGAGIFLWENGIRVLQTLGCAGGLDGRTHEADQWEERDQEGRLLNTRAPLPGGLRLITLTRRDLHSVLLQAAEQAGVELVTSSRAVAAEPEGVLRTHDGRRWSADLAAGADGIHSALRGSLGVTPGRRAFEDFLIYRFLMPLDATPNEGGRWRNYVDYWNLERRRRVLYAPCNPDQLYLMLGALRGDPAAAGPFLDRSEWCRSFPALAELLDRCPDELGWDTYEAVETKCWSQGKVALVGDSAHAMPPTFGQGAGTAMMNGLSLAVRVSEATDVEAALREWEAAERPATEQVQRASIERLAALFPGREDRSSWGGPVLAAASRLPDAG
jgi:2-methyl-3-hydroxypyridine 5-carboxylic acid dioxygenase